MVVLAFVVFESVRYSFRYRIRSSIASLETLRLASNYIVFPEKPGDRFRVTGPDEVKFILANTGYSASIIADRVTYCSNTGRWNSLFLMHVMGEEERLLPFMRPEIPIAQLEVLHKIGRGENDKVFRRVVDSIVRGGKASIPPLGRFARTNPERALTAFPIFERIGTAAAEEACVEAFKSAADYLKKEKLARKLMEIGSPGSLPHILAYAAANPVSFDRLFPDEDVPRLEDFLRRNMPAHWWQSPFLREALSDFMLADAVRHCFDMEKRSFAEPPRVRAYLAPFIVPYFGKSAVPHVAAIVKNPGADPFRRKLARHALINIGGSAAATVLAGEIFAPGAPLDGLDAKELRRITGLFAREKTAGALEMLVNGLGDAHSERAAACAYGLGLMGDSRAEQFILERLGRLRGRRSNLSGSPGSAGNDDYEAALPVAAGMLRTAGAADDLIALLKDSDSVVRRNAAWAFGEIGTTAYAMRRKFIAVAVDAAGKDVDSAGILAEMAWSLRGYHKFPPDMKAGGLSARDLLKRLVGSSDDRVAFAAAAALLNQYFEELRNIEWQIEELRRGDGDEDGERVVRLQELAALLKKKWEKERSGFLKIWRENRRSWAHIQRAGGLPVPGKSFQADDKAGARIFFDYGLPALKAMRDKTAIEVLVDFAAGSGNGDVVRACVLELRRLCRPLFGRTEFVFESRWRAEARQWLKWYDFNRESISWNSYVGYFTRQVEPDLPEKPGPVSPGSR
jgi:HEAT repeat protein